MCTFSANISSTVHNITIVGEQTESMLSETATGAFVVGEIDFNIYHY